MDTEPKHTHTHTHGTVVHMSTCPLVVNLYGAQATGTCNGLLPSSSAPVPIPIPVPVPIDNILLGANSMPIGNNHCHAALTLPITVGQLIVLWPGNVGWQRRIRCLPHTHTRSSCKAAGFSANRLGLWHKSGQAIATLLQPTITVPHSQPSLFRSQSVCLSLGPFPLPARILVYAAAAAAVPHWYFGISSCDTIS